MRDLVELTAHIKKTTGFSMGAKRRVGRNRLSRSESFARNKWITTQVLKGMTLDGAGTAYYISRQRAQQILLETCKTANPGLFAQIELAMSHGEGSPRIIDHLRKSASLFIDGIKKPRAQSYAD